MFKTVSLHPKLVAVSDVVINIIFLWTLKQVSVWWLLILWLLFRMAIWLGMIRLVYYPSEAIRWRHFLSLGVFGLGNLFFLIFTDWQVGWYIISAIFIALPFISFWILPTTKVSLVSFLKPHLRWRFIMCSIGLAGIFSGVGAIISFQILQNINNWLWLITVSTLATALAGWLFWEYGLPYSGKFLTWLLVFFVLMLEFSWVVTFLPLGYLITGLLLVWVWYILWLFIRFHLVPEGIVWSKQAKFIIFNLILIFIFLFFMVRWK